MDTPLFPSVPFSPQLYLGFAGKRVLGDETAVRAALAAQLDSLAAALPGIEIVALGSAAEGADQLFLELATARGWPWRVVLPFAPAIFEQDFDKNAPVLARFRTLCHGAAAIDVIPPPPSRRDGFTLCAEAVARQSDALLVVWDGQSGKQGGTTETLLLARQCDRPVTILSSDRGATLHDDLSSPAILDRLRATVAGRHDGGILASLRHFADTEPPPRKNQAPPPADEQPAARAIRRLGGHGTPLGKTFRRATLVVLSFHVAATFFGLVGLVFGGGHPSTLLSVIEVAFVAIAVGVTIWLEHHDLHNRWVQGRFIGEVRRSLLATAACPWRGDFVPPSVWELYAKLRLPLTTFLGRHRPPPAASTRAFAEAYLKDRLRNQLALHYRPRVDFARTAHTAIKAAFWTSTALILAGGLAALGFETARDHLPAGFGWTLFLRFGPVFLPLVSATLLVLPNLLDLNRRRNSYGAVVRKLRALEREFLAVLADLDAAAPSVVAGVPVWAAEAAPPPADPAEPAAPPAPTLAERYARNRLHTLVQDTERTLLTEVMEFVSFSKNAEVG